MKLNIENELHWMRHFKATSSLSAEQFEALLETQRALFEARRESYERLANCHGYCDGEYEACHDCGALMPVIDDCPICKTVTRSKLPPMAWGVVFDSPEQFKAWKETAL